MMKFALGAIAALLFVACSPVDSRVQMTNQGPAQGSTYSISYLVPEGVDYRSGIDSILKAMDQQMSLWVPASEITRLNSGDSILLSADFAAVVKRSIDLSASTKGNFDITVAPVVKAWGFSGGQYRDSVNIDSLMQFVGSQKLTMPEADIRYGLPKGMQLDVNGVAQGYTVDLIKQYLESHSIKDYLIEVGGEVVCKGKNAAGRNWRIGIDKPEESRSEGMFQTIVELDTMALATSGNYRKYWVNDKGQKVVHTIDPQNGMPVVSTLLSASVIAPDATLADALGTAAMVMGEQKALPYLEALPKVEAYLITSTKLGELKVIKTSGWSKYELD